MGQLSASVTHYNTIATIDVVILATTSCHVVFYCSGDV